LPLQVWFVAVPTCEILPKNTICLTYLKKRSIAQFSQKVTELMESGEPALGIFQGSFLKHSGDKGDYYSVVWDWREREAEEEIEQLEHIIVMRIIHLPSGGKFYDTPCGLFPSVTTWGIKKLEWSTPKHRQRVSK
jgi:hypothetical protein